MAFFCCSFSVIGHGSHYNVILVCKDGVFVWFVGSNPELTQNIANKHTHLSSDFVSSPWSSVLSRPSDRFKILQEIMLVLISESTSASDGVKYNFF